jgi:hypothetical protein
VWELKHPGESWLQPRYKIFKISSALEAAEKVLVLSSRATRGICCSAELRKKQIPRANRALRDDNFSSFSAACLDAAPLILTFSHRLFSQAWFRSKSKGPLNQIIEPAGKLAPLVTISASPDAVLGVGLVDCGPSRRFSETPFPRNARSIGRAGLPSTMPYLQRNAGYRKRHPVLPGLHRDHRPGTSRPPLRAVRPPDCIGSHSRS